MKAFHRNIVEAVIASLKFIFEEQKYADRVVEKVLKSNSRWGSRDRKFIAETTYEMVRWWRLLRFLSGNDTVSPPSSTPEYWRLIGIYFLINEISLPDWSEFNDFDPGELKSRLESAKSVRKIRESIPDWLDEMGQEELKTEWENEIAALNVQANVVLRINTLKTTKRQLIAELLQTGIETEVLEGFKDALVLKKRQNVFQSLPYKNGLFELQDASSQLVAPFLQVEPGMKVIDACAGAGGKSLHIAALLQNKGKLVSMDVEPRKLEELNKRTERAGIRIIEPHIIEPETIRQMTASADRLLLDVPCSGLGVIRRNPDAKWKLSPDFIESVRKTQQEIISGYSPMLKKGGLMVYATCSILPSENSWQVEKFLQSQNGMFELIEERKIMPSSGFDGFYMAKLKRN